LSQFQHRTFSKEDLAALLRDINAKLAKPLDASQLTLIFEKWWPDLEREYQASLESAVGKRQPTLRDQRDLLEEMLSRIRIIERAVQDRFSSPTLKDYLDQAFALLTNRQKQVLREIARANEAGVRIPLDRFSPEDLEDVKRWVSQSEDGLAVIHKVVGEYLTRDSS
jgi:hypothetical protein